jgi:hypothetical protein
VDEFGHVEAENERGERRVSNAGIFGGADRCGELGEVAAMQVGMGVERAYGGGVPGPRQEGAGVECGLGSGTVEWEVSEDLRDYFGGEEDLAGGWLEVDWTEGVVIRRGGRFMSDWSSEGLRHLDVPLVSEVSMARR